MKLTGPDGEIAHAEIKIGPATVMLSGEYSDYDIRSPEFYGGSPPLEFTFMWMTLTPL